MRSRLFWGVPRPVALLSCAALVACSEKSDFPPTVGQPVVNNLAFVDFEGQSGTDRFFVFATGGTYEILGRQYLRSDGKRVLVLVKLMASGQTEGASPTTHALGGSYRKALSNLGLGSVITQVTLEG